MPLEGPWFIKIFWNLTLSCGVKGGKEGGGGDFDRDIPVACCATVVTPSITANGPAVQRAW